ncbi:MAG: hypothetical protein HYV36_08240 [Lentisphaerae bacterium]|nr:hypothetical protein [Lentisphaerota bacterium]
METAAAAPDFPMRAFVSDPRPIFYAFLKLPGVRTFHLARRDAKRFRTEGIVVSALGLRDLIAAKRIARAPKDQADLEVLEHLSSRTRLSKRNQKR